ncbi:dTDP-4-dehydrorhamnose reductase [Acinetobacter indicus]|uniref:dTDP-4-dehydrorhamnose reductase n=1 Tax=Acinetobacter indicus TaxID=756892 RepID=UPI000FD79BAC|nr:dTDP-4-dehydrorhamnose reductase [Acinetobacter indicus]MDM1772190.1 dTDP-4-dehydrorhamnose reductase [Acinetobacter indicus]MDM1775099.1 dTDP-4-dehydrorhamnose reductase [Acinetobacter indicus]QIC79865.1 dTDP-4-dehydrorhamnose reductase [Acinetobacter indicus]RVT49256.1 dTDP-4-dehydrorhamnose reductase [Acinetobacter indicus]
MKVLLLGKNGQVGWELQRALAPLGEVIALDRYGLNQWFGDLTQPDQIYQTIVELSPDVVVNASAYTAVDLAESDQETADLVNHWAVKKIAEACVQIGALFVHYSTDYVFNGVGQIAFNEIDKVEPLNIYGKTKALGEQAIQDSCCNYLIFRTSWVFAQRGKNFLKTMLTLAQQREELSIIDDQIGAPTSAELIADISVHAIIQTLQDATKVGIYHLVASGETSWFEYANYVFEQAKSLGAELAIQKVNPIPTTVYPTPAKRPHNSRLNNQKIQQAFQIGLPDWKVHVQRTVIEVLGK